MRKGKFILFVLLAYCLPSFSQKIDTLYYDNNWKGVESKQFANFVRYASYAENSNYKNRYRDYYIRVYVN